MVDVSVLVPSRHEAGNVAAVVRRVATSMAATGLDWQLVFIDDSEDETVAVLDGLAAFVAGVEVIHRPAGARVGGLGGAVVEGLRATDSRWVVVMDADLQHPPEVIGCLLTPLAEGTAQVVVASRYCAGGGPDGLDGAWRRAMSRTTRAVARLVLPRLRPVADPLAGFFAFERDIVDPAQLHPEGFKILLELLVRGRWVDVAEVPYTFAARTDGRSKAGLREGLRFGRHLARLWLEAGQADLSGPGVLPSLPHPGAAIRA